MQQIEIHGKKIGLHYGMHVVENIVNAFAEKSPSTIAFLCDLIVFAHENHCIKVGGLKQVDRQQVYEWLEDNWDSEEGQRQMLAVTEAWSNSRAQKKILTATQKLEALSNQEQEEVGVMVGTKFGPMHLESSD